MNITAKNSQDNQQKTKIETQSSAEGENSTIDESEKEQQDNAQGETGYDQWYNQSTQSGSQRFTNIRSQKWSAEQNVENYENIQQQSSDFMNLEVVAPEMQVKDIYGSRESINQETLDNDPKIATPKETVREFNNVEVPSLINQPEQVNS